MLRGVTYCRYSPGPEQTEDSIEAQLRENYSLAKRNEISLVKDYIDEERSGKSDHRENFQQMIADAKKGLFDVVICHKIDRFARNRYDSAIYKAQLKRLGIKIMYSGQTISDNPEGRLMEGILESFAEYYSDNLGTEVMKGLKSVAMRGHFTGGYPPLGYDIVDKKYTINESEASIVRLIFELYGSGSSYNSILDTMKNKGYKTKFGVEFGKNSLYSILNNKKYIGILEYNKSIPRIPGKRNGHKTKPIDQIITVENVVPPIISHDLWKRVQERMIINKNKKAQFKAFDAYLLTGIVHCHCGSKMGGHRTKNGIGKVYSYYYCKGCGRKVRKENLESEVMEKMAMKIFSDESIEEYVTMLNEYTKKKFNSRESEIKRMQIDFQKVEREIENIVNAIARGISSQSLEDRLITLEQVKKDLSYNIVALKSTQDINLYSTEEIKKNLEEYKKNLLNKDIVKCKTFISKFLLSVTVYDSGAGYKYCLDTIGADEGT